MVGIPRVAWFLLAGFLIVESPLSAQVKFGDFSTNLSGNVSTGYTADFGNQTSSDHGWEVGGTASFSGSYYSPNFLNFNADLYLNQSRANSNFQSISNSSGYDFSAGIFSGSNYPGRISFNQSFNSEGNYAVPGLADYVTHGDSDSFSVNWSERLPGKPSASFGYQLGDNKYSIYGSGDQGSNKFQSLNATTSYKWQGFDASGFYTNGGSQADIPEIISGAPNVETHANSYAYGFNLTHPLPLRGSFASGVNRSHYGSNYLGNGTDGTIDQVMTTAAMHPNDRLSFSVSANYSDNLSGQLIESVINSGAAVSSQTANQSTSQSSDSIDLIGTAAFAASKGVQTSLYAERRSQDFEGQSYGDESYGASVSYGHAMLDGHINANLNVNDNTSEQNGDNSLGFSSSANYTTQYRGWRMAGAFSYSQNVQTLLIAYMSSFYNYNATVGKRFGKFSMNMSAAAGHTGLTGQPDSGSGNESFNASVGYTPYLTLSGGYTKSNGQALQTGTGLVPVTPPILPSSLISLYGGHGFSASVGSSPFRHVTMSASYSRSTSNTTSNSVSSSDDTMEFNSLIEYQVRKLYFTSGYSRLDQGFSTSGLPSQTVSSFYMGLSRWFNFF